MTEAEFETWLAHPHNRTRATRAHYLPSTDRSFACERGRVRRGGETLAGKPTHDHLPALYSSEAIRDYIESKQPYRLAQIGAILLDFLAMTYGKPTAGWMSVALLQLGLQQFCPPSGVAR